MQVLVIGTDDQKADLISTAGDAVAGWQWHDSPVVVNNKIDVCLDLQFEPDPERLAWIGSLPADLKLVNAIIPTVAELQLELTRINGWKTFLSRPVIEASGDAENRIGIESFFHQLERRVEWVPDICGMITPRIVSGIINEAFFSLEEGVSTPGEIDTAMKLGTNYPFGPFEWAEKIGHKKLFTLLERLSGEHVRYQPSSLLKQAALA